MSFLNLLLSVQKFGGQIILSTSLYHVTQKTSTHRLKWIFYRIQQDYILVTDYRQYLNLTENLKSLYKRSIFLILDKVSQTRYLLLQFMDCTCRLHSLILFNSFFPFGWNT